MARQLLTVNGIATTLIAFIAGLTLNIERLERRVAGAGLTTSRHARNRHGRPALLAWVYGHGYPLHPGDGPAKLAMIA